MLQLIDKKEAKAAHEFTAEDAANQTVKLADFRARSNVLLVLNRGFS